MACCAMSCMRLPDSSRSRRPAYGSAASHTLNDGSRLEHMPEVSDTARMSSSMFSGSWSGSERTMSPNSSAKSVNSRGSTLLSSAKPIPPKRANSARSARSSSAVSAEGSSTPISWAAVTRPRLSRPATAISRVRRPSRRLSGTSAIIPKSMKVRRKLRPVVESASGVTKMLPGCGSACTKLCVNTWSNMTSANTSATSAGSMPAARRASVSLILIAVTSESVSTRRVDRSQTISGALTRGSPAKFSRKRSALAASCR